MGRRRWGSCPEKGRQGGGKGPPSWGLAWAKEWGTESQRARARAGQGVPLEGRQGKVGTGRLSEGCVLRVKGQSRQEFLVVLCRPALPCGSLSHPSLRSRCRPRAAVGTMQSQEGRAAGRWLALRAGRDLDANPSDRAHVGGPGESLGENRQGGSVLGRGLLELSWDGSGVHAAGWAGWGASRPPDTVPKVMAWSLLLGDHSGLPARSACGSWGWAGGTFPAFLGFIARARARSSSSLPPVLGYPLLLSPHPLLLYHQELGLS